MADRVRILEAQSWVGWRIGIVAGSVRGAECLESPPPSPVPASEGTHLSLCLPPLHCPTNAPWPSRMGKCTTKAVPPARV